MVDIQENLNALLARLPSCVDDAKKVLAGNKVKSSKIVRVTFHFPNEDSRSWRDAWKPGHVLEINV